MKVIEYKDKYYHQVKELAGEHNLNLPKDGKLLVVVDDNGKVLSLACMRMVVMIEPFISKSPVASYKLWVHIKEKATKGGIKIIRAFIKDKDKTLLEKLGFYQIFPAHHKMEINFYNKTED